MLKQAGARALVVLSRHARDPYLAPFLGGGRLGHGLLIAAHGRRPRLGFLSPMERDEAARSGLELLTPQQLDVQRFARQDVPTDELWANVVERALHLCEVSPSDVAEGDVALTGTMPAGLLAGVCRRLAGAGWSFVPGESVADLYRKRKSEREIEAIRRAADGTGAAMFAIAKTLASAKVDVDGALSSADGSALTVGHLRALVARVLAEHGLEQPEGNIVAPAEEGAVPHTVGTNARQLRAGESLVVDIFPRGEMFADCTRTFCVGEPSPALAEGYRRVLSALELAEDRCQVGVSGWSLHQAVCELFEDAGYATTSSDPGTERGYVHGLGHGVGYELHELPSFREHAPDGERLIESGDVITLEPGLYEPDPTDPSRGSGWAVRLEDLYVVRDDGLENLTPLPRALDPRAWIG